MTFSSLCEHICLSNEFFLCAKCHMNLFLKATVYKVSQNQCIKCSCILKLLSCDDLLLVMHMASENVHVLLELDV